MNIQVYWRDGAAIGLVVDGVRRALVAPDFAATSWTATVNMRFVPELDDPGFCDHRLPMQEAPARNHGTSCRNRLQELGLPYPKSGCVKCGSLLRPGWKCADGIKSEG